MISAQDAAFAAIAPKEPVLVGDVYQISTKEELAWFRDAVNGGQTDIKALLTADIDLGGEEWTPIGGKFDGVKNYFFGIFDGGGHTISGLNPTGVIVESAQRDTGRAFGLFGYTGRSEIKNLTVSSDITAASDPNAEFYNIYAGLVMGYGAATITNCVSDGSVTATGSRTCSAGGIAGYASGEISGCANLADVSASGAKNITYAGGIAGDGTMVALTNCTNAASGNCKITATSTDGTVGAGGIVGNNAIAISNISGCINYAGGSIIASGNESVSAGGITSSGGALSSCANYGSVTSEGGMLPSAGGIAAEAYSAVNCVNYGGVSASSTSESAVRAHAGGVIAEHMGLSSDSPVESCQNSGSVTITTADADCVQYAGGIVGQAPIASNIPITNCQNSGTVSANGTNTSKGGAGGILGASGMYNTVENCVNTGAVSGAVAGSIIGNIPFTLSPTPVSNCAALEGTADKLFGSGGDSLDKSAAQELTREEIDTLVNSVAFDKTFCAVKEGETAELKLVLSPNASAQLDEYVTVTGTPSTVDTSIATATYSGGIVTVTGVAEGETALTLDVTLYPTVVTDTEMKPSATGQTATLTCTVTVTKDGGVTLSDASLAFDEGGAAQELTASVPSSLGAVLKWTWTSSNTAVATCEDLGSGACRVTPAGVGNATITVEALTASGRTWTASCAVTVTGAETPDPGPDPDPTPEPEPEHHGGGGGGCSAGWGALALLAIAPLFLRRGR